MTARVKIPAFELDVEIDGLTLPPVDPPVDPVDPPQLTLSLSASAVEVGAPLLLTWDSVGATLVRIGGVDKLANGTMALGTSIAGAWNLAATAVGPGGETTKSVSYTVTAPPPDPPPTGTGPSIEIIFEPQPVLVGITSICRWTTRNVASLTFDLGSGPNVRQLEDVQNITPSSPGSKRLTWILKGTDGSTKTEVLDFTAYTPGTQPDGDAVKIDFFRATPAAVQIGSAALLEWSTKNAGAALLTDTHDPDGPDAVPVNGSLAVSPDQPTTYSLTASGPSGSVTKTVSVTILAPGEDPPPVDPPVDPPPVDPIPGPRPDSKVYTATPENFHALIGDASPVHEGDDIECVDGVFPGGNITRIEGTKEKPIRIYGKNGPWRTRIDCYKDYTGKDAWQTAGLDVNGGWVDFYDIEIMSSVPRPRRIGGSGSSPGSAFGRSSSIYLNRFGGAARGVSLRNLVIHDCRSGPNWGNGAAPVMVDGCLIFNNGWSSDRGHGHAIYAGGSDNRELWNIIQRCFAFRNLGMGMRYYGTGEKDAWNAVIRDSVSWNSDEHHRSSPPNLWTPLFWDLQVPGQGEGYITGNLGVNAIPQADGSIYYDGWVLGTGVPSQPPQKKLIDVIGNDLIGGDKRDGVVLQLYQYQQMRCIDNRVACPDDGMLLEYDGDPCVFQGNEWYSKDARYRNLLPTQTMGWDNAKFGSRIETKPTGVWDHPKGRSSHLIGHPTDDRAVRYAGYLWDRSQTTHTIDLSEKFNAGDVIGVIPIENYVDGRPEAYDGAGPSMLKQIVHQQTLGADRKITIPTDFGKAYPKMLGAGTMPVNMNILPIEKAGLLAVELRKLSE